MAYTRDWSNAIPVDHSKFKDIPGTTRNLRVDLEERMSAILYGFVSGETNNFIGFKKGRLITIGTGAPSAPTGTGAATAFDLYARANGTGAAIELWGMDASGNEIKFTDGGVLNQSLLPFKTGDWILSTVTTARTGWTNVSATYSNKFMRINATALSTGGADTHTTPSHTLITAEMPAHEHTFNGGANDAGGTTPDIRAGTGITVTTTTVGGGGGHTHSAADNVPAYVTVIVWQKN